MLIRVKRLRPSGAIATCNFPINAVSRAAVDAENARVRQCVIPISGLSGRRPHLFGSAVALTYRGRTCLATAFHLLANKDEPRFFFGADGFARPLVGRFVISTSHDIAAIALAPEDASAMSHVPCLREEQIGSAAGPDGRFYASVAGYPLTASKQIDKMTLDTPMEVYSNVGREEIGGLISVSFDRKVGAWDEEVGHITPRVPTGKSGGAIFGMPLLGFNGVQTSGGTKLVGIPTDWKKSENRVLGASVAVLIPLLERATRLG
jgi:hypothetical protein